MKKKIRYIALLSLIWAACNSTTKTELHGPRTIKGLVFGDSVLDNNVRDMNAMLALMQKSPATKLKVRGVVDDVCKKKGCWITMKLPDGETMRITFKDYAFFVPKDIVGKEVVIDGEAKSNLISIEEQRHFAAESGLAEEEIDKITTPKKELAFEASGVVIL